MAVVASLPVSRPRPDQFGSDVAGGGETGTGRCAAGCGEDGATPLDMGPADLKECHATVPSRSGDGIPAHRRALRGDARGHAAIVCTVTSRTSRAQNWMRRCRGLQTP